MLKLTMTAAPSRLVTVRTHNMTTSFATTGHVVVVYRGLAFDLTAAQFGKSVKRIIGEDVSILEAR